MLSQCAIPQEVLDVVQRGSRHDGSPTEAFRMGAETRVLKSGSAWWYLMRADFLLTALYPGGRHLTVGATKSLFGFGRVLFRLRGVLKVGLWRHRRALVALLLITQMTVIMLPDQIQEMVRRAAWTEL
jgi:hypothetical protein